jgi:putative transposase
MVAAKIKSITAREIFSKVPSVKKELWGGEFWTDGYFVSTVSEHANEDVIRHYVRNQGRAGEYKLLHNQKVVHHEQLTLFANDLCKKSIVALKNTHRMLFYPIS